MTAHNATKRLATTTMAMCALLTISCDGTGPLTELPASPIAAPRFDVVAQGPNLIRNPSLETTGSPSSTPANWSNVYWGSKTPTFTYPATGHASARAAQLTQKSNSSGDGRYQPAAVAVTSGVTYTYSEWYKSNATTQLDVEFTSPSGAVSYIWLMTVASSGNAWKQLTATFVIPSGVAAAAPFHLISNSGSLTIDEVSLTAPAMLPPSVPTLSFSASPSTVASGQQSTLSWTSTNAAACSASGGWSGAQAVSGTSAVAPTATTTYSLSCSGAGGSVAASTTVTVSSTPPPPSSFALGMVTLSFDDSWLTQYQSALPILQAASIKGTFYLTTAPLFEFWTGFMTTAMVQDIAAKGHEIAGHTVRHPNLTTIAQSELVAELNDSKTYLQNLTGQQVTSLAYPYGVNNANVKSAAAAAGYTSARGVSYDVQNTAASDKYDLRSRCIESTVPISQIQAEIDAAKANKQWYILCFHEVKDGGDNLATTPARFQQIVNYVKSSGIKIVTVKEGRALMN